MKQYASLRRQFLRYLRLERNYSPNTLEAYAHDVDYLLNYIGGLNLAVEEVRLEHLEHFAATIHEFGVGARTQARILSGVRTFFRFLVIDGVISDDPTELLESPDIGEHLPEVLSTEEVDMMERAIDLSKWEGQRNKAIIETLFSCGLRVSELVTLRFSDIFAKERYLRIVGKGGKERLVPISQQALHEIELWLYDRNLMTIKPGEEEYLFLNRRGPHTHHDSHHDKAHGSRSRHQQDRLSAHIAPLFCHGTAQRRSRPACHPGDAGA